MDFLVTLHIGRERGYLICNTGLPASWNQEGFSVAGSPEWDDFLCHDRPMIPSTFVGLAESLPAEGCGGERRLPHMDAEAAKLLFRPGETDLVEVEIAAVSIDVGSLVTAERARIKGERFRAMTGDLLQGGIDLAQASPNAVAQNHAKAMAAQANAIAEMADDYEASNNAIEAFTTAYADIETRATPGSDLERLRDAFGQLIEDLDYMGKHAAEEEGQQALVGWARAERERYQAAVAQRREALETAPDMDNLAGPFTPAQSIATEERRFTIHYGGYVLGDLSSFIEHSNQVEDYFLALHLRDSMSGSEWGQISGLNAGKGLVHKTNSWFVDGAAGQILTTKGDKYAIWDLRNASLLRAGEFKGDFGGDLKGVLTGGGTQFALARRGGFLIGDTRSGDVTHIPIEGFSNALILSMVSARPGQILVHDGEAGPLRLIDMARPEVALTEASFGPPLGANPRTGTVIARGSANSPEIVVLPPDLSAPLTRFTLPTDMMPLSAAISDDSSAVLVGMDRGQVLLFDARNGTLIRELGSHTYDTDGVLFAPDGKTAASWSDNAEVIFWGP